MQTKQTKQMPETVRKILIVMMTAFALAMMALEASAQEVGQKAPDFQLAGAGGKPVTLSDLTSKGPVVIYTFIQAFTGT